MDKVIKQDLKLNFQVPISEKFFVREADGNGESSDFVIKGKAITETITSNGHEFLGEELKKSAKSLCDKPLLKDHINSVDSIVGRTTNGCKFDKIQKAVMFEAKVMDEEMQNKIEKGMIDSVSVGAMVDKVLFDEERDVMVLQGIHFKELSLVAVPADSNANFAKAIACAMDLNSNQLSEKSLESKEESNGSSLDFRGNLKKVKETQEEKMEQDKFEQTIQEKDSMIAELKKSSDESAKKLLALEKAQTAREESDLKLAKEAYNALAKKKGVVAIDVSEATKEVIAILTKQLENVKESEESEEDSTEEEEKVDNTKGEVSTPELEGADESAQDYFIAKDDVVKGVGLFKNPYTAKESSVYFRG